MRQKNRVYKSSYPSKRLFMLSLLIPLFMSGFVEAQNQKLKRDAIATTQSTVDSGTVNINTASEEELVRLPGIGPSKATAILTLRKKLGEFKKVESLMRIRGIGRKTLRKLRPMLTLSGKTTLLAKNHKTRSGKTQSD